MFEKVKQKNRIIVKVPHSILYKEFRISLVGEKAEYLVNIIDPNGRRSNLPSVGFMGEFVRTILNTLKRFILNER